MASGILSSFLGAFQASLSVLLTIFYGVLAFRFNLLSDSSATDIAILCVKLFLPALLISDVGSQLHWDTAPRYIPILIWAVICNAVSLVLGYAARKIFKLPNWVIPAITFNNTTSLPLILTQSLASTGILSSLLMPKQQDNVEKALHRANSYFLVNAMVYQSLTFALGPKIMSDGKESEVRDMNDGQQEVLLQPSDDLSFSEEEEESMAFLSRKVPKRSGRCEKFLASMLQYAWSFVNAPLIGALIGALLGLTPPLHKAFFSDPENGGFFSAWLTLSIKNLGDLFASLQIIGVGVKLVNGVQFNGLSSMPRVPWTAFLIISFTRFILWPGIAIPLVYVVSRSPSLEYTRDDPILLFTLMLMPVGPPALTLSALGDITDAPTQEKGDIAMILTLSYLISPMICFSVVGSLKASESAIGS